MLKKLKHLPSAITKAKKMLENRAKKKGLTENFGRTQVHRLTSDYIDTSSYSEEMNDARDKIYDFNNWCMNYEG